MPLRATCSCLAMVRSVGTERERACIKMATTASICSTARTAEPIAGSAGKGGGIVLGRTEGG
eukprot:1951254-Lingulodinium_polyedra.AAC.1